MKHTAASAYEGSSTAKAIQATERSIVDAPYFSNSVLNVLIMIMQWMKKDRTLTSAAEKAHTSKACKEKGKISLSCAVIARKKKKRKKFAPLCL